MAEQVQRGLDRCRAGGAEHGVEDVAQRGVDLRAPLGLVDHPAHLLADDVAGHEDPAGAAEVQRPRERGVVAGVDREAVDRLEVVVVGLLDAVDVLDLRQLGEQVGRHVDRRPRRDVVEEHRLVGRRCDLGVMRHDAAPVGLVVVRRDRQRGVHARRGRRLGKMDRVARVVGAGTGDDRGTVADLGHGQRDERDVLLVGHRRRLARGAGDDDAVGPVIEQVVPQPHGGVLVDAAVRGERRDRSGQDGPQAGHGLEVSHACSS